MHRRVWSVAFAFITSTSALSQTSSKATGTGVIAGVVYDSLAHRPLPGATVDLAPATVGVGMPAATTTDSAGHYEFDNVAPGTYMLGFFHPWLDTLGIDAPVTKVDASAGRRTVKNLSTPSAKRVHEALCHSSFTDSTGMLMGHVENATTGARVAGATVTAQWAMMLLVDGHLNRVIPTARAVTTETGWFAFCSLPSVAPISVQAGLEHDSSGVLAVVVPMSDVAVRTLFVGAATAVVTDSLHAPAERAYRGPGKLAGGVYHTFDGKPLADVRITVQGTGLVAVTDSSGEFAMRDLPLGSQTLLARKVGYVPSEVTVDILAAGVAHADVTLPTIDNVLDTVRVIGKRVYDADENGFLRRKTLGIGSYFDAAEIVRIAPFQTTDLLRRLQGVRITHSGFEQQVLMRGIQGDCTPEVYIDGTHMNALTPDELDALVWPETIAGMEVYTSAVQAPPEFKMGKNGCGLIAVWTQHVEKRKVPSR